jgi:hemoglobin-like flavoprotein
MDTELIPNRAHDERCHRREGSHADAADGVNALLTASLERLAGRETEIVDGFYALFFERHPTVRGLFGEHGINEREEMIRETLASVLAHVDGEPWLDDNLEAMGRSHAEYGVEGPMYDWYVESMLETLEQVDQDDWEHGCREEWRSALDRLTTTMRSATTPVRSLGTTGAHDEPQESKERER